ncbi:MAG: hypothetical protein AAF717_01460 [Bacteroidota bacterium]
MKKKNTLFFSRIKVHRNFGVLVSSLFLIVLCSCSDDEGEFDFPLEGENLSISDIAGNWTSFFVGFQDLGLPDDQSQTVDFSAMGATTTLNIQNDGRFTSRFSLPGGSIVNFSGQMGFQDTELVILDDNSSPGDEVFFSVNLDSEDVLRLGGILELDFDEDGTIDETVVSLAMVR